MNRLLSEGRVVSLLLFCVSIGLFWVTFSSEYSQIDAFSPMFFPRIILGLLFLFTLTNVITEFLINRDKKPIELRSVIVISVVLLIYANIIEPLGFFLASVAMSIVILLTLGMRRPLPMFVLAVGIPGAIVMLFNHILTMPLPTSPFVWWL